MSKTLTQEEKQAICSKKMGALLIQGYAMLAEVCPDCMIPIMRSRSKEDMCVICDQDYKKEDKKDETKNP